MLLVSMQIDSLEDQRSLQSELNPGEVLLWSGKPNPRAVFHASDLGMIPFSILWAGFSILWEAGAYGYGPWGQKGAWGFGMIWGIPFVVVGQYMVWGRFLYVAWKKRRITYALTNERVLLLVRPPQARVISSYLRSVPGIDKEIRADSIGTLKFGGTPPVWASRGTKTASDLYLNSSTPVFVDIDNAAEVADRVNRELRRIAQRPLTDPR